MNRESASTPRTRPSGRSTIGWNTVSSTSPSDRLLDPVGGDASALGDAARPDAPGVRRAAPPPRPADRPRCWHVRRRTDGSRGGPHRRLGLSRHSRRRPLEPSTRPFSDPCSPTTRRSGSPGSAGGSRAPPCSHRHRASGRRGARHRVRGARRGRSPRSRRARFPRRRCIDPSTRARTSPRGSEPRRPRASSRMRPMRSPIRSAAVGTDRAWPSIARRRDRGRARPPRQREDVGDRMLRPLRDGGQCPPPRRAARPRASSPRPGDSRASTTRRPSRPARGSRRGRDGPAPRPALPGA